MMQAHFLFVIVCLVSMSTSHTLDLKGNLTRIYQPVFEVTDLLNRTFERKISKDLDLDPCKAGMQYLV